MIEVGNMRFLPHPDRPRILVHGALELTITHHTLTGDTQWEAAFVGDDGRVAWGYGLSPEDALADLAEDLRDAVVHAQSEADAFHRRWQAADRGARNYARYLENLRAARSPEEES